MSQTTDTISVPAPTTPRKACAIVGTAGTWKRAPWSDPAVDILGLNDGYVLGMRAGHPHGLPRMNYWFDLHPIHQMSFHRRDQTRVNAAEVPTGAYLRPEGHLDWLKTRMFPVFLNEVPAGWPAHAQAFPRAELEAKYGTYFTSTPAWMLVWAIEQGYTEIHLYGIHLATEWEYVSQRPNLEFWLRHAIDRGVKIVLPEACPLLKAKHVYAYEPKPDVPLHAMQTRIAQVKHEGAQIQHALQQAKWYERGRKADLAARLQIVQLELADAQQAQRRLATVLHA